MKKIVILGIVISIIVACSPDEESIRDNLIDQWKLLSITTNNFNGIDTIDYSQEDIIYHFKNNGKLIVTGKDHETYPTGEYEYKIIGDPLKKQANTLEGRSLYIEIDKTKWSSTLSDNKLILSTSYLDGPSLELVRN